MHARRRRSSAIIGRAMPYSPSDAQCTHTVGNPSVNRCIAASTASLAVICPRQNRLNFPALRSGCSRPKAVIAPRPACIAMSYNPSVISRSATILSTTCRSSLGDAFRFQPAKLRFFRRISHALIIVGKAREKGEARFPQNSVSCGSSSLNVVRCRGVAPYASIAARCAFVGYPLLTSHPYAGY